MVNSFTFTFNLHIVFVLHNLVDQPTRVFMKTFLQLQTIPTASWFEVVKQFNVVNLFINPGEQLWITVTCQ